jgi:hypothetical protein
MIDLFILNLCELSNWFGTRFTRLDSLFLSIYYLMIDIIFVWRYISYAHRLFYLLELIFDRLRYNCNKIFSFVLSCRPTCTQNFTCFTDYTINNKFGAICFYTCEWTIQLLLKLVILWSLTKLHSLLEILLQNFFFQVSQPVRCQNFIKYLGVFAHFFGFWENRPRYYRPSIFILLIAGSF